MERRPRTSADADLIMAHPPRLMVVMPCRNEVKATCFLPLAMMFTEAYTFWKKEHGADAMFVPLTIPRMHVTDARVYALETAFKAEVDYIMWVDDDMTPPAGTVEKLYRTMVKEGAALVSALCYRRGEPYGPCAFTHDMKPDGSHNCWMERLPERIAEAYSVGFGCVLMDVEQARHVWDMANGQAFLMTKGVGEDAYYCRLAKNLGQRILVDTSCVPGHVGEWIYDEKYFESVLPNRPDLQKNFVAAKT